MVVVLPFRLLKHQVPMDGTKVAHRTPEFTPPCVQRSPRTAHARGHRPKGSANMCLNSCLRYLSTFLAAYLHLLNLLTSPKVPHPPILPACGQYGAGNSIGRAILYSIGYLVPRSLVLYPLFVNSSGFLCCAHSCLSDSNLRSDLSTTQATMDHV